MAHEDIKFNCVALSRLQREPGVPRRSPALPAAPDRPRGARAPRANSSRARAPPHAAACSDHPGERAVRKPRGHKPARKR